MYRVRSLSAAKPRAPGDPVQFVGVWDALGVVVLSMVKALALVLSL